MNRSRSSPGSWTHVFTLRERVVSTVEVLDEPQSAEYVAVLADGTPAETRDVLDRLVGEGVVRADGDGYEIDPSGSTRRDGSRDGGVDASELDPRTLGHVEAAVREAEGVDPGPYAELSEYEKGRLEGYSTVLSVLSELRVDAESESECGRGDRSKAN